MSLENEIRAAIRDGLTGLTLWRVGASTIMWQSASRWHGHDAFCVAIEADPIEAQRKALAQRPVAKATRKPSPAEHFREQVGLDPAPAKKPSLDDWNDDATVAALDSATIPAADAFEW